LRREEGTRGHCALFWSASLFLAILLICAFGKAFALARPRANVPSVEPIGAVYFTTGRSLVLTPAIVEYE